MKALLTLSVAIAGVAFAQEPPSGIKKPAHPRPAPTSTVPVTLSEAREAFMKANRIFSRALNIPKPGSVSIPEGAKPISREAIVAEMVRFYETYRSGVKITPRPVVFDASRLRISPSQKPNLLRLVKMGAVAKIGPLATGPGNTLTIPQFGDALGFFLARMAYMTHLPSSKWTPSLRSEGQ